MMSDILRKQTYHLMNLKETEELLDIWRANERYAWTDTAFEVVHQILQERLGEVPSQNDPAFKPISEKVNKESGVKFPLLYNPEQVLWLDIWLNRAAVAMVVIIIILSIYNYPSVQSTIRSSFLINSSTNLIVILITLVIVFLFALFECILVYFSLKSLAMILKILMAMELNSRSAK